MNWQKEGSEMSAVSDFLKAIKQIEGQTVIMDKRIVGAMSDIIADFERTAEEVNALSAENERLTAEVARLKAALEKIDNRTKHYFAPLEFATRDGMLIEIRQIGNIAFAALAESDPK